MLDRNPFQRGRVEALELGERPSLADLRPLTKRDLVADQERHPPYGTNLTYPLDRYTQLFQTSGTTAHPAPGPGDGRGLGLVAASASRTLCRPRD